MDTQSQCSNMAEVARKGEVGGTCAACCEVAPPVVWAATERKTGQNADSFYSNSDFEVQRRPDRQRPDGLAMLAQMLVIRPSQEEASMLYWALVFLIVAIIAAIFGFGGVAVAAAGIAKLLFFVFLVVFIITLITGLTRRGGSTGI
jgi:uncharacterized membrane protein YtjA (UPF0391 family)